MSDNIDYYDKIAPLYDTMYGEPTGFDRMAQAEWVDEWREKCGLPKSVLDVACGTGQHLACFEALGYRCAGIDASRAMLHIARAGLNGTALAQGQFHTFRHHSQVPLITCFFNSLTYTLTRDDLRRAFENIHYHLSYNGLFIFDLFCAAAPTPVFSVKTFEANDLKFSRTLVGQPTAAGFLSTMYYVIFDGLTTRVIEGTTLRGIFSEADIRQTLAECDFTILHTRSGPTTGTLVFVAQK